MKDLLTTLKLTPHDLGVGAVENYFLPKWHKAQIARMSGVRNFGVRQNVSEISDVVTDASIRFIGDLRAGTVQVKDHTTGYRLFQKYVGFELKKHRTGREIHQRDGSVSYPEGCFVSGVEGFEAMAESSATYELTESEVKRAVEALETDSRFELLKLSALEGWGKYQLAQRLGTTWFIAVKELEKQRTEFISEFNLNWLV